MRGAVLTAAMLALVLAGVAAKVVRVSVVLGEDREFTLHDVRQPSECAYGEYFDNVDENGWGELTVEASDHCSLSDQGFAMGVTEGYLTANRIWEAFQNFNNSNSYLIAGHLPPVLADYVTRQTEWLNTQVQATNTSNPMYSYWQHANILLQHAYGVSRGYQRGAPPQQALSADQVYILAMAGDLEDLSAAMPYLNPNSTHRAPAAGQEPVTAASVKPGSKVTPIHMDCSGLVKLGSDDLFVGHTTFNSYWCMLRIFKHYKGLFTGIDTAASTVSFSSRPGDLESKDDFFLLSSHLVVIETSLSIFNTSLYSQLTPESVPVWLRVQVANRMAASAPDWIRLFSLFNSGTHNNEWIVTDYNKYMAQDLTADVVWLLDQLPGIIESQDVTQLLVTQGYIPSYNIPFFPSIMNISGYTAAGYNYFNDTRAQIFRRDQVQVSDLDSMSALMNRNNYQNDPLSGGNPCNQISARCDLAGDAFGGIDSKNVDVAHVFSMQTYAIGAPSHVNEPVFEWTAEYEDVSHIGMPQVFNFNWTTMAPAF